MCKVQNVGEIFAFLFLLGSQPAANVHRWNRIRCHLFFYGSQPPPTIVQHTVSSHMNVFFNEPNAVRHSEEPFTNALAAEAWPARKRSLWREDVLRQTINQECMATWEKSELLNELLRNSQPSPKHSCRPLTRGRWRWDTYKLSLGRGNTRKRTAAPRMANHYSEELQRTTAGRISKQSSAPTVARTGAQTTGILLVEGTHVHWQATAEQFFFSKFNMRIMFI